MRQSFKVNEQAYKSARNVLRFESMSQNIWPRARKVVGRSVTPRCRQCVISANVPGVELEDGLCNRCRSFNRTETNAAEASWEEKIREAQWVIGKTDDQGISYITRYTDRVYEFLETQNWPLVKSWSLPDGSRLLLWRTPSR